MALLHVNCFSDVLGKCVNLDVRSIIVLRFMKH